MTLTFQQQQFVQTDFRFLLPLKRTDVVCLWNGAPELIEMLQESSVEAVTTDDNRSYLLDDASIDHVIAMEAVSLSRVAEIGRILKPNGHALLGAVNRHSIDFLLKRKSMPSAVPSLSRLMNSLTQANMEVTCRYGVHDHLWNPQFWIPLERRQPAAFFWKRFYVPNSASGEWMRRVAVLLSNAGKQEMFFKEMAITARKIQL